MSGNKNSGRKYEGPTFEVRIRIPEDLKVPLKRMAEKLGLSKNQTAKLWIIKKLTDHQIGALERRLIEVKVILAEAARTQGKSLSCRYQWNDYHDEQVEIEEELIDIELENFKTVEHYAR